jgi:hypothetical protein
MTKTEIKSSKIFENYRVSIRDWVTTCENTKQIFKNMKNLSIFEKKNYMDILSKKYF